MADDLVIGGQLGSYLIESVIGRGGMSVVYRAKHARLGTSVALKVLAPELSSDDTFRERFLREAQMAAGVDHPNVIPIHDMGLHGDSLYIVMRYVSGGDLKALLAASGPLNVQRAISLLKPVGDALDAAHADALVHRDVKPGNILIQRSAGGEIEHVYLTDFGVAKSMASVSGLTRAGGLIGTVEYMAPEQSHGDDVSTATDLYSFAAVFYECITGHTPFERELAAGAWPPSGARPGLPAALDAVLAKALAQDPGERHATCEQFLRACSQALAAHAAGIGAGAGETLADTPTSGGTPTPGSPPSAGDGPRAGSDAPPPGRSGAWAGIARRRSYAALVVAAVVVAAVAVLLSSSSKTSAGELTAAALAEVPTNNATGSGSATVRLKGNSASVTVTTDGLDYNEALTHALHIHAGGKGLCPPASAARLHNGHPSISTTDGIKFYGPPVQSLTTRGDTSPSSILVFPRYPTGGSIRYTRTITVPAPVAALVRENNAVIVVHGTDYDHTGIYSGVLERSELNRGVPATATAPALCGTLLGAKTAASASPGARGRELVYTASLAVERAAAFICEAEAIGSPASPRRRAAAATAPRFTS